MNKKFYVTTPIYYPNDKLHIGHAYTTTLADYINRYKKMNGYETMFLTGSDEHGQKIFDKAKEAQQEPLYFVTKIIDSFKQLWSNLDINYDLFIRTTDKEHKKYVSDSFVDLLNKNFIYKSEYTGLYCKSDEAYFTKTQVKENECPECGKQLETLSEESYFLKISNFKNWIKNSLKTKNILIPKHRINELMNNFINELKDLSVTRTSFDWGIKIKGDEKHVIYVWLDALQNYISALTYDKSKFSIEEVWDKKSKVEILQLVGKEITRFHCIYWPILLKMKNMRMPNVLAHGWIISDDGNKMSKSIGNVVDPLRLIEIYGSDAIKFYLINNIVTGEDGKFSQLLLEEMINGLLVNKYSNLIARTDAMVHKYFNGIVPEFKNNFGEHKKIKKDLFNLRKDYFLQMDSYKFSSSTKTLIKMVEKINLYIDLTTPWKAGGKDLETILNVLVNEIFNITTLLSSILTKKYLIVYNWLNYNNEPLIKNIGIDFANTKLNKINHLFSRIENKENSNG